MGHAPDRKRRTRVRDCFAAKRLVGITFWRETARTRREVLCFGGGLMNGVNDYLL